ncbi:oligosaccharide flippase family protein [Photobacterium leiognathi]|uniref:oligosaccharide flippase family protein n=1 Tax=Photobacterium leiognathi TaxID=553611 RepID=UPI0034E9751A
MNYRNVISLFFGHFSNYLVPFSMIFLLSRSLDESDFSFFMYSQVVLIWAGMFIEYGFTLRAIRYLKKDNIDHVTLYNLIQSTKIVLSLVSVFIVLIVLYLSGLSSFYNYILVCLIFVFFGLRANWYFIAKEDTSIMTIIDLIVSVIFIGAIFFIENNNLTYVLCLMVVYRFIPTLFHFLLLHHFMILESFHLRMLKMR